MTLLVFVLVLLLSYLFLKKWKQFSRWDHFPGASKFTSLPIIGHGLQMIGRPLREILTDNKKKYGAIYRFDVGNMQTVFLTEYEDIVEAFKTDAFGGRVWLNQRGVAHMRGFDLDGDVVGLSSRASGSSKFKEHKKFTMSALSDIGVGKTYMEDVIVEEVKSICDFLQERSSASKENKVYMNRIFALTANNVIWRFVTGRGSKRSDPEMIKLEVAGKEVVRFFETQSLFRMVQFYSVGFSRLLKWLGYEINIFDVPKPLHQMIRREAEAGAADAQGSFVDRHLEMQQQRAGDSGSVFSSRLGMDNLRGALWDLFFAGTDTSATFIEWAVIFLMKYPEVQERMHKEIKEQLGSRSATLKDRGSLPYVESFILETFRCNQMVDLGLPHRVEEDVIFRGKLFPKGTQVFPDFYSVRHDSAHWGDPDAFRPDRFLVRDGDTGLLRHRADERVSPFGVGKRRCMGEVLATAETFLFTVGLVQQFEFREPEGQRLDMDPISGIIGYPKDFEAIVKPRF